MRPLGQTRPLLAYGVPAAAGLVAGGALAAQGEDPGSAVLGGVAAGLGARGALGAARLAGKYAGPARAGLASRAIENLGKAEGVFPARVINAEMGRQADLINLFVSDKAVKRAAGAVGVPLAAGLAGMGGLAAGSLAGSIGIPGFQQGMDPEGYGSNNTDLARMGVPTLQYT